MQRSVIAAFATIALLTALPTVAEGVQGSFNKVSLALAGATGHILVLQDMPDVSLRLAFATATP